MSITHVEAHSERNPDHQEQLNASENDSNGIVDHGRTCPFAWCIMCSNLLCAYTVYIHVFYKKTMPPYKEQHGCLEADYLVDALTAESSVSRASKRSRPSAHSIRACASCHNGHARLRACSPSWGQHIQSCFLYAKQHGR